MPVTVVQSAARRGQFRRDVAERRSAVDTLACHRQRGGRKIERIDGEQVRRQTRMGQRRGQRIRLLPGAARSRQNPQRTAGRLCQLPCARADLLEDGAVAEELGLLDQQCVHQLPNFVVRSVQQMEICGAVAELKPAAAALHDPFHPPLCIQQRGLHPGSIGETLCNTPKYSGLELA